MLFENILKKIYPIYKLKIHNYNVRLHSSQKTHKLTLLMTISQRFFGLRFSIILNEYNKVIFGTQFYCSVVK